MVTIPSRLGGPIELIVMGPKIPDGERCDGNGAGFGGRYWCSGISPGVLEYPNNSGELRNINCHSRPIDHKSDLFHEQRADITGRRARHLFGHPRTCVPYRNHPPPRKFHALGRRDRRTLQLRQPLGYATLSSPIYLLYLNLALMV